MRNGQNTLITGGEGSFGKRYTRTLLERYKPKEIITLFFDKLKLTMSDSLCNLVTSEYFLSLEKNQAAVK